MGRLALTTEDGNLRSKPGRLLDADPTRRGRGGEAEMPIISAATDAAAAPSSRHVGDPELDGSYGYHFGSTIEREIAGIRSMRMRSLSGFGNEHTHVEGSREEAASVTSRLADENRLLEMVASGGGLQEALIALCEFVERHLAGCFCAINLIDRNGKTPRNFAAGSETKQIHDAMGALSAAGEVTPCSQAKRTKTQVIVTDVEIDPLWRGSPFSALALAHGFRAHWSTPICSPAGQALGTVSILRYLAASPTAMQQKVIARVTQIAGLAVNRAQRESTLTRREAFLVEAQRLSSTGSFYWDVSTDEITWSEHLYRVFEFEQGVPVTIERIRSRVHPEDRPLFDATINQARFTTGDFDFEHRLVMEDHSIKYLRAVAHATCDEDGGLEYIGAVQDVTQRRLSEAALGKARAELARVARNMSLGALTASIAHEIRQPLAGIVTNANTCLRMLAMDTPDMEGIRETARRTLRDGNRASDVITRLRALFANKPSASESVDLNELVREVIALLSNDFLYRRISLKQELDEQLPPLAGDRIQFQQVILNLLQNAVDAMSNVQDRPKELVITTRRDDGDRVRLSVQDSGVGVGPNGADLFEPFFTTKSEGLGIGLFVCRLIIESHSGRLWAIPNEGPGATFSFSVPGIPGSARTGMTNEGQSGFAECPA